MNQTCYLVGDEVQFGLCRIQDHFEIIL